MNTEKQATEIINAYTQMNQLIWNSWADIMQGWQETFERSTEAWTETFRTATELQLTLTKQVGKLVEENMQRAATGERKAA